ncbi:MAG: hypothetical protein OEY14_12770, partial [Myxococcales bacterium]|nr:hypothetical protein [Myxococcales bacterium]
DEVLALSELLLRDHEEAVGALTDAAMRGDASSEAYPEAALVPGSELWDDVLQVAEYIAQEPGLLEALLRSFADPRSHRLGHIYAEMMSFRDPIALDSPDFNRELLDQEWTMPVDRGRSDTGDNVSLFQQSIAIIHDLSGVRVCNRDGATLALTFDLPIFGWTDFDVPFLSYGECELFEIQDVAETFALSIIGRAEIQIKPALLSGILAITGPLGLTADSLLEGQSGIVGLTTRPTPQALARLVFAPRGRFLTSLIGPPSVAPLTRDGVPIVDQHDPVVMAWERSFRFCGDTLLPPGGPCASPEDVTFYEAMTPLLTAFDDHDRRTGGRFLFASLISAFHLHYASPANDRSQSTARAAPFFSHQDDAVSFEPIVAELFADCVWEPSGGGRRCVPERGAQLLSSLAEMQVRMDGIELRPGVDGIDAMAALASRMIDPTLNGALRDRRGGATTQTNAGSRTLPLTPIYLLLDALSATDARWASEPDRHARWLEGRGVLVDTLLATTRTAGGARMNNRRSLELLRIILPFVRDRIAAHRAAGDLHAWASTLDERLGETLGSAQGAALLRFLDAIQRDPIAREEIAQLTAYLVSDASANDAFDATVLAAADLLQLLEDDLNLLPLLHALSGAVAEGAQDAVLTGAPVSVREGTTDATIALAQELGAVDDTRALGRILANLVELPSSGPPETPLEVLVDVISEVGRASPGEGGTLSAEDYHHVMGEAVDLLSSEERGLERLYDVIQNRELSP